MGEINFLASNTSSGGNSGKKDKKGDKKEEKAIKWTKSKVGDSKKTSTIFGMKKNENLDTSSDQQRIEKSRQEVLEMIDKNKKSEKSELNSESPDKEKNTNDNGGTSSDKPRSWMSKIFNDKNKAKKESKLKDGEKNKEVDKENNKKNNKKKDKKKDNPSIKKVDEKTKTTGILNKDKKIGLVEPPTGKKTPSEDSPLIFNSNTWNSSGVLETNLIDKSEFGFFDSEKKLKYIIVSVLGSLCLVCALYLGLLYWEHTELDKLKIKKDEIADLELKVKKLEDGLDIAKAFQERLGTATALLDRHVYWTNFFSFLEEKTLSNVYYSGDLDLATIEDIELPIRVPDYATLKDQLIVFANDPRVTNITKGGNVDLYIEKIQDGEVTDMSSSIKSIGSFHEFAEALDLELIIDDDQTEAANQEVATSTEILIEAGVEASITLGLDSNILLKEYIASSSVNNN